MHSESARIELLVELAVELQRAGMATQRLESTIDGVATALDLEVRFFAIPTALWIWARSGGREITRVVSSTAAEIHLTRLTELRTLCRELSEGTRDADSARSHLARIRRLGAPPAALEILAFASLGAGAGIVLGGALPEALVGGLAGLGVGALAQAAPRLGRLFDVLAATLAASVALAGALLIPGLSAQVAMLSGLIVLVPGFTIHQGMSDLSTGHLVSGTSRLAHAGTTLLLLGFGVAMAGAVLGGLPAAGLRPGLGIAWRTLAALAMTPGLLVLFRAPVRDAVPAGVSVLLAWFGALAGAEALGAGAGTLLAALGLGLYSNGWSRLRDRPASTALVPGLMLLVPGSLGFRAIDALLGHDPLGGLESLGAVLMVSASLVTGLLVANGLLPDSEGLQPPSELHTPLSRSTFSSASPRE